MPNVDSTRTQARVIALVDAQRRTGALADAQYAAEVALSEHPYHADLHDALARVMVDAGELQLASDAWETARALAPGHVGALKGLGFLAFRRGDVRAAQRLLTQALSRSPEDSGLRGALERLQETTRAQAPGVMPPHQRGADDAAQPVAGTLVQRPHERELFLLLCDSDGLVLGGSLGGADGALHRAQVACEIGALSTAIDRACQHLGLGGWVSCLLEGDDDAYAVGRAGSDALVLAEALGEGAAGRVLVRLHDDARRALAHIGGVA